MLIITITIIKTLSGFLMYTPFMMYIPFIGVGFYRQECPISGVLRHFLTLVSCSLNFTCASIIHNDSNPSLNLHSLCVFNLWKKELVPLNSSPPHLKPRCSSIPYSFVFLFSSRQWYKGSQYFIPVAMFHRHLMKF